MPVRWYERTSGDRGRLSVGPRVNWVIVLGLFLLVIVAARAYWMPALSRALEAPQEPVPADAIVVLGGGSGSRQDLAVLLFEKGYAPVLVSSGSAPDLPGVEQTIARLGADYMVGLGAPRDAIILLPDTTSTHGEALACLQLAQQEGLTSLLVITDSYHTRRARLTFAKVFENSGVRIILAAAEPDWFAPDSWWTEERSLLAVLAEYAELAYYLAKGYI